MSQSEAFLCAIEAEGATQGETSGSLTALRLGGERRSRKRGPSSRVVEWILISIAVLYAAGLLIAPLVAIVWGSLAEGINAFASQVTSADALSSFKLTLLMTI